MPPPSTRTGHPTNMNFAKKLLLAVLTVAVSGANADNYEGYVSHIEGVGLWWLDYGLTEDQRTKLGASEIVLKRLRFGENPEFASFCDGKNKLFIYEKAGESFPCKTEYWQTHDGNGWKSFSPSDKTMLRTIERAKKDRYSPEGQSEYFVSIRNLEIDSQRIFTVSKTRPSRGSWNVSTPTKVDLESSTKLAAFNIKNIHREKGYTYKSVLGYSNKDIKKLASRGGTETYTLKLQGKNKEVILLPTLYEFMDQGGDLISTVVLREHGSYRFIGHVYGCLLSVGADLDSDGIPEVILESCENGEGVTINYIKLFPKIKSLISYEHS